MSEKISLDSSDLRKHFFLSLMGIKKMRIKRFIKPFILIVVAEIRLERMTFGL